MIDAGDRTYPPDGLTAGPVRVNLSKRLNWTGPRRFRVVFNFPAAPNGKAATIDAVRVDHAEGRAGF